jgi:hypothetical protein
MIERIHSSSLQVHPQSLASARNEPRLGEYLLEHRDVTSLVVELIVSFQHIRRHEPLDCAGHVSIQRQGRERRLCSQARISDQPEANHRRLTPIKSRSSDSDHPNSDISI